MPRYMCPAFGALSAHRTTSGRISKQDHWQNAPMRAAGHWIGRRDGLLALVAAAISVTLGYLDSRPSWDDTGITAALLLLTSAMSAGLSGRRPWLWALLTGVWIPVFEVWGTAGLASLAALGVSTIGAFGGYLLLRMSPPQA
jgi:predicted acyltransferase